MIRRIVLIAHAFEIFLDNGGWNKGNIHFRTDYTFKTIARVVPVKGIEFRNTLATDFALDLLWK